MLKEASRDKLHDFNPLSKIFRQRAEHIKEARRLCNEASLTYQSPLSAVSVSTILPDLDVQYCTKTECFCSSAYWVQA
jgi:hypothetical protein